MKCLEIARLQDFAPNTQGPLGVLSGPKPPAVSNEPPPLKISAYGPVVLGYILAGKEIDGLLVGY